MTERALQTIDRSTDHPFAAAIPGPRLGLPTQAEMESLKSYGQLVVESGMAPKHIDKWETAVVIMRYGHQLGVDEFTALQNMYVIGGKPSMMASLMHAMILRDHGDDAIHVKQSTAEICELVCKRRNASESSTVTYTMAEATAAQLPTTNAVWKKYPADMLFARAISRAGRQVFRDTTMGLYVPEELGGNVIEAHGEVIEMPNIRELRPVSEPEPANGHTPAKEVVKANQQQLEKILALADELGIGKATLRKRIGKTAREITSIEASSLIGELTAELDDVKSATSVGGPSNAGFPEIDVPAGVAGDDQYSS